MNESVLQKIRLTNVIFAHSPAPVAHGVEVFRELDQIGGLLLIVLLDPHEQLSRLQLEEVLSVHQSDLLGQLARLELQDRRRLGWNQDMKLIN